jgi:hypothetical protein
MHSIKTFHLDRKKSGELLKAAFHGAYGVKRVYREVAEETDIPLDTVSNCLQAKNDISLERLIKFCLVSNMPLVDYLKAMFDGVDIDFRDQLHLIIPPEPAVNNTEPKPSNLTQSERNAYERGVLDMYERQLDRFKDVHSGYRESLIRQHVAESKHLTDQCNASLAESHDHIASLVKGRNFWRTLACVGVGLTIIALVYFVWEMANPTEGLTRLIFDMMRG